MTEVGGVVPVLKCFWVFKKLLDFKEGSGFGGRELGDRRRRKGMESEKRNQGTEEE